MPVPNEPNAVPRDPEDPDRFRIHDPREIVRVLQALAEAGALISAQILPGGHPCPTAILRVEPEAGGVLIDGNRNEAVNQRMAAAEQLACVSRLDRIRIEFRLRGLRRVEEAEGAAFHAPLPEWVLKLQRRELYRVALVPGPMATVQVPPPPPPPGTDAAGDLQRAPDPVLARVLDLSGSGLALAVRDEDETRFRPGAVLADCLLQLPGTDPLPVALQVAHLSRREPLAGASLRAGCRFVDPAPALENRILRYIFRLERQRSARERRAV